MPSPAPPLIPPGARRRLRASAIAQMGAWLLLVVVFTITARSSGAAVTAFGVALAVLFGWLLWQGIKERRVLAALAAADQYRIDAGGWENMTPDQQAQWLADVRAALEMQ
jgi:hypothetical protein